MHNTKLISLLKSLDKKEMKKLGEFVESPFFNKNKNIRKLFGLLHELHPGFDDDTIDINKIYLKVYDKSPFDYHRISNLSSDLFQLSKSFLSVSAFQNDRFRNKLYLLEESAKKKLSALYLHTLSELSKGNKKGIADEEYYFKMYLINRSKSFFNSISSSEIDFNLLQDEYDSLLDFFLPSLLKMSSKMLYNSNHGKVTYSMPFFEEVRHFVFNNDMKKNLLLDLYKLIVKLELTKDENDYKVIKEFKDKYADSLAKEDLHNLFIFMNSFISNRLNKFADESYYKDRFEVLKESVEKGFVKKDFLAFTDFTYYYISACTVGEFDWAENFLENFKSGIYPREETENALNFCNAYLNYRKKNFEKALEYYSLTNFKMFFMKVTVKSFTIRILYELNLESEALAYIDAFRHYLKSEKMIHEDQKKAHYEFMKFTAELFKIRNQSKTNKKSHEIKSRLLKLDSNAIGVKSWLLKKADELENI